MNIVILDGYALNPGDLSWEVVRSAVAGAANLPLSIVELSTYERTEPEHIVSRVGEASIILTNKTPLTGETLRQLPQLRYIGVLATGYDVVDVEAAIQQGITVTNVPSYGTDTVAQYVFAMLLSWCHRVEAHDQAVKRGAWSRQPDFSFWLTPQTELAGKTFGIIGYGRIGQKVAQLAHAFGMRVLITSRSQRNALNVPHVQVVTQDELLAQSDVVSLHCPLNDETKGMVNKTFLNRMKSTAVLINTARGALVNEAELAEAVEQYVIEGALLDVLSEEPPQEHHPLIAKQERIIITPHMAWASQAARRRLLDIASGNIAAYLNGMPQHVVSRHTDSRQ
ncbi:D-2-hydroxyacid dehydrogenase [Paenibacillus sp. MER TA 81-3]|uniref:D-2-hydroxyacid dehydrogenase n=1 Tax=Paenibacillus sp. MER TA 81-3 TaxID=2939573 RepID=UPI00203D4C23|nr:D-2-hydroxyacid dehydrogenase [Paenibacillus sp. MER TA 81-3]MCM3341938.1 D-2-hydroxyacid dehydrogenase [Paenibacillus sp. MER TA 81-3]